MAAGVIHTTPEQPYHRSFKHVAGRSQLDVIVLHALLGVGRLLTVDRVPHEREELPADDPCEEPREDAHG